MIAIQVILFTKYLIPAPLRRRTIFGIKVIAIVVATLKAREELPTLGEEEQKQTKRSFKQTRDGPLERLEPL